MSLAPGTKLSHFEIRERIGAGGMGEVYRALDTTLRRDVAIKLLPEAFARDAERVSRFKREAQLLAALNHPNIATIYGLFSDSSGEGQRYFLVMELVGGETLAEMIQRCRDRKGAGVGFGVRDGENKNQPPLADARGTVTGLHLDEALNITTQICEALEHAHEHGVIHRDLKPANVKVTPEGKVKVLDFGLAKAFAADGGSAEASPNPGVTYNSQSPTLTASPTIPGVILGTAAYMSPEQARGKQVDKRTDIWALGCVLYEMLTGRPAFAGEDVSDILANVLKIEPDWSLLSADTPPGIVTLLRRCLTKDAIRRYHSAADVLIQIEEVGASQPPVPGLPVHGKLPAWQKGLPWVAVLAVAAISGVGGWYLNRGETPPLPVMRFETALPGGYNAVRGIGTNASRVALSPDGTRLAWVGASGSRTALFVRDFASDSSEIRPIPDTDGAEGPFFSPDGQWIGFFASGKLKKVPANGGAPITLCDVRTPRGASWGSDGMIYFTPDNTAGTGLYKVPAAGGTAQRIAQPSEPGEATYRVPEVLPGGKSLLFAIQSKINSDPGTWQIAALSLETGEKKILVSPGTYPHYLPSGHLVYYLRGTVMAVPFDVERLELEGNPAPVLEGVMATAGNSGGAHFAFSQSGSLVYIPGSADIAIERRMVWVDRKGLEQPIPAPPRNYAAPKLSPDGRYVAAQISGSHWVFDLSRNTLTRLTFEGNATLLMWTPDSRRIAFTSNKNGPENLFWKLADGSGPEEQLTKSENRQLPGSFTPDGKTLIYTEQTSMSPSDIWVLPLEGERKPRVWLAEPPSESAARLSPDGRWMAYSSDESGIWEVYVRPFPGPGGKWQISSNGGAELVWSPLGNEIFYRTGPNREMMMAVDIQTKPTFSAGNPRLLFEGDYAANTPASPGQFYSVSPDGQRFLMLKELGSTAATAMQMNVVLNWFEELKQKVPVK